MVNKSLFVFIALMVCVASLCAQPIYRCGNTFQQTPCDEKGGEVITFKEAFNSYGRSAQRAGSKSVQGLNEAAFNSFYLKNMPACWHDCTAVGQDIGRTCAGEQQAGQGSGASAANV